MLKLISLAVLVTPLLAQQTIPLAPVPPGQGTTIYKNIKAELYRRDAEPSAILTVHGSVAKAMWETFTTEPYSHRGIPARKSKDGQVGCYHYSSPESWECFVNYER